MSVADIASATPSEHGECYLPIDVSQCEKVCCQLCGSHATDDNPLSSPTMVARWGKYWPWRIYSKSDDKQHRYPIGKCCRICMNVFCNLGLDAKHG